MNNIKEINITKILLNVQSEYDKNIICKHLENICDDVKGRLCTVLLKYRNTNKSDAEIIGNIFIYLQQNYMYSVISNFKIMHKTINI